MRFDPTVNPEYALIYAILVAGKTAKFAADKTSRIFETLKTDRPFTKLACLTYKELNDHLVAWKTGNYSRLTKCIYLLSRDLPDLTRAKPRDLETFPGIGPKTSRFFILWTRPGSQYAALDVHILSWLRDQGHPAPKSTPSGNLYRHLEQIFLDEAADRGLTPRELDLAIWRERSGNE